jgi:hypothetical protein
MRPGSRLGFDDREVVLADDAARVVLRSLKDQPLRDAEHVVVRGEVFATEHAAETAGLAWRSRLERALAAVGGAADFGDRAAHGGFTNETLELLCDRSGHLILNDVHGLMTHPAVPTVLVRGDAVGLSTASREDRLRSAIGHPAAGEPVTEEGHIAFDLYSASFGASTDARFMLLMMAFETLVKQQSRGEEARMHVDSLIAATQQARLPEDDRQSLLGSLARMMQESITQAAKRVASTLGDRLYDGRRPVQFIAACYAVRHRLVHGQVPRPSRDEVGRLAAQLTLFMGHLIAGPTLVAAVMPPDS